MSSPGRWRCSASTVSRRGSPGQRPPARPRRRESRGSAGKFLGITGEVTGRGPGNVVDRRRRRARCRGSRAPAAPCRPGSAPCARWESWPPRRESAYVARITRSSASSAIDHGGRAVGAIVRQQRRHDLVDRVDREMNRKRGARRGEASSFSAGGIAEARPEVRVSTTDWATSGRSAPAQCRSRGGERRHARRDGVRRCPFAQTAKLLAHGAPHREIARVQSRDSWPCAVAPLALLDDLVERHRAVSTMRACGGQCSSRALGTSDPA